MGSDFSKSKKKEKKKKPKAGMVLKVKKKKKKVVKIKEEPKRTEQSMSFPPQIHGICHAWYGLRVGGKCGYCKDSKECKKYKIGATIHHLKCSLYDSMIQKNWVRCGNYFYQPQNRITCCPQYQNRLDVQNFKIKSKYRRVLKKVNHWLKTGERRLPRSKNNKRRRRRKRGGTHTNKTIDPKIDEIITRVVFSMMEKGSISRIENLSVSTKLNRKIKGVDHEKYQLSCGVVFQIIGLLRKKKMSSQQKGMNQFELAKSIADECQNQFVVPPNQTSFFTEITAHPSGFLHISIPKERFKLLIENTSQEETEGEQEEEEEEEDDVKNIQRDQIIEEGIDFELKSSVFVEEEFQLYKKFQKLVLQKEPKKDKEARKHFFNCHIKSPLLREKEGPLGLLGYGAFHYTYRLRKSQKLIAVSIIDVIPSGIFSLYFFYDPEYSFLELGKYSVFHEVDRFFFSNKNKEQEKKMKTFPEFRYYYFGFYVHDCQKMRYKAQFKPQQVLCNVTWKYCDLDRARKDVLSKSKFGKFSLQQKEEEEEEEEDGGEEEEKKVPKERMSKKMDMMIMYANQLVPREIFSSLYGELTTSTERKMDEFCGEMSEWVDHLVYVCNKENLVKYERKKSRKKK